jgi:hypothetical protein
MHVENREPVNTFGIARRQPDVDVTGDHGPGSEVFVTF